MKNKFLSRKTHNPNEPVFTGKKYIETPEIQILKYNENDFKEERNFNPISQSGLFTDSNYKYWLNIHGIHDTNLINKLGKKLDIHRLAIQDILDVNQRPKFQEYEEFWFLSLKSILPSLSEALQIEQLSFVVGSNFLVSFQERKADYFEHVRIRIRNNTGVVRERGVDYLLYLLLESILDNYFLTLNDIHNKLEYITLTDPTNEVSPGMLNQIEIYKRQVNWIKKVTMPIKDFSLWVERDNSSFIEEKHLKYYFELKDICFSLTDQCDQLLNRLESNTNLFFSIQGNRMNQIMKTLTIVATIFIPLTFIAGIYGMNFSYMPELNWKWGYFGIWGVILIIFVLMLVYFRRKKWF